MIIIDLIPKVFIKKLEQDIIQNDMIDGEKTYIDITNNDLIFHDLIENE